jgi:glycosyltransferase involved in cell wall biosynthesis
VGILLIATILFRVLLSICILTYNRKALLAKAIDSIIQAEILDNSLVEVIVLDNGSTDDTLHFLTDLKSRFALKVIREEINMRGSCRFQQLANVAHGDWIIFLGDDDIFDVEALKKLAKILSQASVEVSLISFGARLIDQDSRLLGNTFTPPELTNTQETLAKLIHEPIFFFPATVFRRDICLNVVQPTIFFFDWAMMLYAVVNGRIIRHTNALIYYRIHEGQEQNSFDQRFRDIDIISSFTWLIQNGALDDWLSSNSEEEAKEFVHHLFSVSRSNLHVRNLSMAEFLMLNVALKVKEYFPRLSKDISIALVENDMDPRLVCNKMEIPLTSNYLRLAYEIKKGTITDGPPRFEEYLPDENIETLYLDMKRNERSRETENMLSAFETKLIRLLRFRHSIRHLRARIIRTKNLEL